MKNPGLFLLLKWKLTGQLRLKEAQDNMRPMSELILTRDDIYDRYLSADRTGKRDLALQLKASYSTLDWLVKKLDKLPFLLVFLFLCNVAYATSDYVIIQDPTTTGKKANVVQVGTTYGLASTELPASTIYNNKVTTNAGSRVQLSAVSTSIKSVSIKALATNTGTVYVGNSTVASTNGYQLAAGDAIDVDVNNLNGVYIDVSVNGEGITYIAVN
jgi:hypothetical protein